MYAYVLTRCHCPLHTQPHTGHDHTHTTAFPCMGTKRQVPIALFPNIFASKHTLTLGVSSPARPLGYRLHNRGMQTAGDALPEDVRERPRGNHTHRNPGKHARLRRAGPSVPGMGGRTCLLCHLSHHPVSSEHLRTKGLTDHDPPSRRTESRIYYSVLVDGSNLSA